MIQEPLEEWPDNLPDIRKTPTELLTYEERLCDILFIYLYGPFLTKRLMFSDFFFAPNYRERTGRWVFRQAGLLRQMVSRDWGDAAAVANKVWLFTDTINQYHALAPLHTGIADTVTISSRRPFADRFAAGEVSYVNFDRYRRIKDVFPYLRFLKKVRSGIGKRFNLLYHHFFNSWGEYEACLRAISDLQPSSVIVSNDHTPFCRALMHACLTAGVPVIYLQHACTVEDFPPLRFSLSLLDGQETLDKYAAGGMGIFGATKLVGASRFDGLLDKMRRGTKIQRIGIPFSRGAQPEEIETMARAISDRFPDITVTLRPHPADQRTFPSGFNQFVISNSKQEKVLDFIAKQDLIIADDTSTHLEAIFMNVVSWYFQMSAADSHDIYGFVRNGLIDEKTSLGHLLRDLEVIKENAPYVRSRIAYYYSPYGTSHDGNALPLTLQEIKSFLSRKRT